jgi:membrane-associated phospholipid phosphatase
MQRAARGRSFVRRLGPLGVAYLGVAVLFAWALIVARIAGVPFGWTTTSLDIVVVLGPGLVQVVALAVLLLPWLYKTGRCRDARNPFSLANLGELLRCTVIFGLCLLAYSHLKVLLPLANTYQLGTVEVFDPELIAIERAFGLGETLNERMASYHARWFQVFMHWCYTSFYFIFHLVLAFAFVRADREMMRKAVAVWAVAFIICLLGQYMLPALGPGWLHPDWYTWKAPDLMSVTNGNQSKALYDHLLASEPSEYRVRAFMGVVAFPSMHVAHLVAGIYLLRGNIPRWAFRLCHLWIGLVAYAAAYWGYHYVSDVVVGAFLGWWSFAMVEALSRVRAGARGR